ncbi:thiamine diphosphokinase [Caldisalinibacter kiritimatiensis]|uniref:Thiamine diphosphokinase n=1 Tax=Caldisalinibacter kiritimatiensis TaxID=1304284 RepID=R1AVV6_9FIRM|nr:thiamine diphosphokinase [Caldisalinibacter kiritimatiensis]EOD01323.1 Thiamin pyrophosphokinase [Caldisalinibacter kiritimatiensis]
MKALIISSGNIKDTKILVELHKQVDLTICADGGSAYAIKANIEPDIVIGDLDSIDKGTLKVIENNNIKIFKYPTKKDMTDTELAIEYAIEKGVNEIIFTGVTGNRLDHTLSNIMLLYKLLKIGVKGKIIDSNNEIYITDNSLNLQRQNGTYVSIIPLVNDLQGVTLKGFEYETENIDIKIGSTLGISNEIKDKKGSINIKNGVALVIKSRD